MEHHVQAVEDHLIEGLNFKMRPGSSYVTERRNTTFFPSGGNSYSTSGVRVIRFNLTGTDSWLDPTTVKIAMDVVNDGAGANNVLIPLTGAHGFFSRARVYAGGALLEDIFDFGRFSQMFSLLQPHRKRINDFVEGFAGEKPYLANSSLSSWADSSSISAGGRKTVMFTPYLGIFLQDRYLPLRYCNIQIELELAINANDPIQSVGAGVIATGSDWGQAVLGITDGNASSAWHLENVRLMADTITLDSELENQFASHLLSGKNMPIQFSSWTTNVQSTGGNTDPTINITRSLTRLKDVFVTFYQSGTGSLDVTGASPLKNVNYFKHPAGTGLEFQMVIGNKVFPDFPLKNGDAEFFQSLKKSLGIQDSSFYDIDINPAQYASNRFIIGMNLERVINSSFTGFNTKAGDLVNLRFKNLNNITHITTTLHYDVLLNIRDIGCEVLD